MRAHGGLSLLVLGLILISSLAFAGDVADYSSVFLSNTSVTIAGPGVSKDGFLNSLTDVGGLLRDFKPGQSDSVRVDSTAVEGNELSINAEVHRYWTWFKSPVSGNLRFREGGCSLPSYGGTFTFKVNDPERVRAIQFKVCAKPNPDHSLSVAIAKSLIAGPDYSDDVGPIISEIFATADQALAQHTLAYLDQTGGGNSNLATNGNSGAYGLGGN